MVSRDACKQITTLVFKMSSCPAEAFEKQRLVQDILDSAAWYEDFEAIKTLEGFVTVQMHYPVLYNVDANLAVLKHYLMFGRNAKASVMRNILIQALMHLPATDFDLCLCQISLEHQNSDPVIRSLIAVEGLLQTCCFPMFWNALESDPHLHGLSEIPDFKDAIRRFMAGVISLTYHTFTMEDAGRLLQLDPITELPSFSSQQLKSQWVCDTATGVVSVVKAESPVALVPNKSAALTRPLFSESVLDESLSAVGRMITSRSTALS